MKTIFLMLGLFAAGMLPGGMTPAEADGLLREAQAREHGGAPAEAVRDYERVYLESKLPAHLREAALCGLLRTDGARLETWLKNGLAAKDESWRGTVAQAAALLPPERLGTMRKFWLKSLPESARLDLLKALIHVKAPLAREFLSDVLAKSQNPALRLMALEGLGRTGTAAEVDTLVTWMQSGDADMAAAARRGLISIDDVKADERLAARLKPFEDDAPTLAKLLDVLAVRNALGFADALVPFLSHADVTVRTQAFRAIGQQGLYAHQAAVLAAAAKAKDGAERKEARRAVARIARRAGGVQFKARRIGNARTEACGVADFDGDGKLDIIAGPYLYRAPEFRPVKVREVKGNVKEDGKGYAHDFMNLPLDVNGNGRPDVVSGNWFSKETWWIENLLPSTNIWTQHLIEQTGNIETGILVDIDGDGKATDFLPDTQITCLYQLGKGGPGPFTRDSVSNDRCDMGRGCGDLNGDGRNDVLTPSAWYEHLADGGWRKHPLDVGFSDKGRTLGHASNLIVYDVNKDGLADILVSSAHKYGIFWWEQLKERNAAGEIQFKKHVIDNTWSQAHYLGWGDIDGDGVPELITGKRFMAHNGGDPDEYGHLGIYYYDFTPGPDPVFRKYVIAYDTDISVGLNVEAVDLDGDGDLDLVTTGKWGGPVILENKTKSAR